MKSCQCESLGKRVCHLLFQSSLDQRVYNFWILPSCKRFQHCLMLISLRFLKVAQTGFCSVCNFAEKGVYHFICSWLGLSTFIYLFIPRAKSRYLPPISFGLYCPHFFTIWQESLFFLAFLDCFADCSIHLWDEWWTDDIYDIVYLPAYLPSH